MESVNAWTTMSNQEFGVSEKAERYFAETMAFALDKILPLASLDKVTDSSNGNATPVKASQIPGETPGEASTLNGSLSQVALQANTSATRETTSGDAAPGINGLGHDCVGVAGNSPRDRVRLPRGGSVPPVQSILTGEDAASSRWESNPLSAIARRPSGQFTLAHVTPMQASAVAFKGNAPVDASTGDAGSIPARATLSSGAPSEDAMASNTSQNDAETDALSARRGSMGEPALGNDFCPQEFAEDFS